MRNADELAKEGAMIDGGALAQVSIAQQDVYAAPQYAVSLVKEWKDCQELEPKPKEQWIFANRKGKAKKHRTEWCGAARNYRCMGC